jgi:hypothetical protein
VCQNSAHDHTSHFSNQSRGAWSSSREGAGPLVRYGAWAMAASSADTPYRPSASSPDVSRRTGGQAAWLSVCADEFPILASTVAFSKFISFERARHVLRSISLPGHSCATAIVATTQGLPTLEIGLVQPRSTDIQLIVCSPPPSTGVHHLTRAHESDDRDRRMMLRTTASMLLSRHRPAQPLRTSHFIAAASPCSPSHHDSFNLISTPGQHTCRRSL